MIRVPFIILFLLVFTTTWGQTEEERNTIKKIENEIDSKAFDKAIFSDNVIFVLEGQVHKADRLADLRKYWAIVKPLFYQADFVILVSREKHSHPQASNIKSWLELKSHDYFYFLGIDEHNRINFIEEIPLKNPLAPTTSPN